MNLALQAVVSKETWEKYPLISVRGRVGTTWKSKTDWMYFEVDLAGPDGKILLDIPSQVEQRHGIPWGGWATVTGFLVAKTYSERVSVRLQVHRIDADEQAPASDTRKRSSDALDCLKTLERTRREFPRNPTSLTIVRSKSFDHGIDKDFLKGLGRARKLLVEINDLDVEIQNPEAVAAKIRATKPDLLAVIRGGGDKEGFAAFDAPEVLQALADSPAYRVLGVGHNNNATLADFLVEHVATTPSAAGTHLRDEILARVEAATPPLARPSLRRRLATGLILVGIGYLLAQIHSWQDVLNVVNKITNLLA
jgi:hypothetical protein